MAFPFQKCLLDSNGFTASRICQLLAYQHSIGFALFDLNCLAREMLAAGEEQIVNRYLFPQEQAVFTRITSAKRKRDWLGGRFAARYAAAEVLAQPGGPLPWNGLAILPDDNGRPFVASAEGIFPALPDVSISHSGDLAAAMAVSRGFCGIDIQKVTGRVNKVQERFCSPAEEDHLQVCSKENSVALTMLWAAKEALRKVAKISLLPGFMDLELQEVSLESSDAWRFIVVWHQPGTQSAQEQQVSNVLVSCVADYALALTVRNAKVC